MYKSQLQQIDPYDCFVVQGHIWFSKAEVITFIYLLECITQYFNSFQKLNNQNQSILINHGKYWLLVD